MTAGQSTHLDLFSYLWIAAGAVSIFYASVFIVSALRTGFLVLVRGQGLVFFPVNIVVFGKQFDLTIFGVSVAVASGILVLRRIRRIVLSRSQLLLVVPSSVLLFAIVEVAAAARWVAGGFIPGLPFGDASWKISFVEMQFVNTLYLVAPRIMLIFLLSWLFALLSRHYPEPIKRWLIALQARPPGTAVLRPGSPLDTVRKSNLLPNLLLTLGLALAIYISAYPYLPAVNPGGKIVGVDTPYYLEKLESARGSSAGPFPVALSDDRILLHLLNYALSLSTGDPALTLKILPAVLSVLLVVSTFFFVRIATGRPYLGGLASLFTPLAFQQIVGINAGFYANWLALVEANLYFAFLLRALKRPSFRTLLGTNVMLVLVLFTHPWTWFVLMASLAVFMLVGLLTTSRAKGLFVIPLVVAVNISVDAIRTVSLPFLQSGAEVAYSSLLPGFSLTDLPVILGVLEETFGTFLGGALYNYGIILLSILGFLSLRDYRDHLNRLLLSLAISGLIGIFLFSSDFVGYLHARALYVIPFALFAALGFDALTRSLGQTSRNLGLSDSYVRFLTVSLGLFVTTVMFNHVVRMAATVYPYVG